MSEGASSMQLWGAGLFGAFIGWFTYFVNRYRKADVQLGDVASIVGVVGGGSILALFPAKSDLFAAYGIGLFGGFFGYLLILAVMVGASKEYDFHWFLDGRRRALPSGWVIPADTATTVHPMDGKMDGGGAVRN